MLDEKALLYHEYELALETAKMYDEDRMSYYEDIERLRDQLDYVLRQVHDARMKADEYYRKADALLAAVDALSD